MDNAELPKYQSHKTVWALKIAHVHSKPNGEAMITPVDESYASFTVSAAYVTKHAPQPGGYYVKYADGYESWSPADAFEEGYTRI